MTEPINYFKLIESVRKREVLYDTDHQMYGERYTSKLAWNEVMQECNLPSIEKTKSHWRNLRTLFSNHLKTSGEKRCRYFRELQFLQKCPEDGEEDDSNKQSIKSKDNYNQDEIDRDDNDNNELMIGNKYNVSVTSSFENNPTVNDSYIAPSCSYGTPESEQDNLKIFFNNLYDLSKRLSAKGQQSVKKQCLQIIIDVEENEMTTKK